jgi:hypothetical protein
LTTSAIALTLLSELRDRIYGLAVQDITEGDVLLVYLKLAAPAEATSWERLRRTGLGLTQTCRKVREKLLPMYNDRNMTGICTTTSRISYSLESSCRLRRRKPHTSCVPVPMKTLIMVSFSS